MNDDLKMKIAKNPVLSNNLKEINFNGDVNDFAPLFFEYFENYHECQSNDKIAECCQKFPGYKYTFICKDNILFLTTMPCEHTEFLKNKNLIPNNYVYCDLSPEFFTVKFVKGAPMDTPTEQIMNEIKKFLRGIRKTGIYISGDPGVGKTYLLIQVANKLASKGFKIAFVVMETLIGRLKDSFDSLNKENSLLLQKILSADIIFLDDIGAGLISPWVRDEVLFRLLNGALNQKKPIFFSSNFKIKNLKIVFENLKGESKEISAVKTKRVIDRINGLATEFELRREKSFRTAE